jgi:hypothetical protein
VSNYQEVAYLLVADVSEDLDEPDITHLKQEAVGELDRFLENEVQKVMANDGRRLIRWMSSKLNDTPIRKSLGTAYIAEDQARERQYVDVRIPIKGKKVIVAGCFDEIEFKPRLFFLDRDIWETAHKLKMQVENPASSGYAEALGLVLAHELVRLHRGTSVVPISRGGLAGWQKRKFLTTSRITSIRKSLCKSLRTSQS